MKKYSDLNVKLLNRTLSGATLSLFHFAFLLVIVSTALTLIGNFAFSLDKSVPYVNADDVHGRGITGANEIIAFLDVDGADNTHPNLPKLQPPFNYSGDGLTIGWHATWVAGVVGSSLPGKGGVAPGATLYSVDYASGPFTEKGRTNAIMDAMDSLSNVKIWNMSAQLPGVAANGQSKLALFLDYFSNTNDIVFCKSAGNEGAITAPGAAYNIITVGGTGHGSDPNVNYSKVMTETGGVSDEESGEGETDPDGRSKPDIVAPGQRINSTRYPRPPNEVTASGTSGAAPHVAGVAALLRDYADDVMGKVDDHRVIKAVMLNAADKDGGEKTQEKQALDKSGGIWRQPTPAPIPGTSPLDEEMGAGQLNAIAALTQYSRAEALAGTQKKGLIEVDPIAWDFNTIGVYETVDYMIKDPLIAGSKLTTTLVWDRVVTWTDDGEVAGKPDFEDKFEATLSDLDMVLLYGSTEIKTTDPLGRYSYSESKVDNVEHIYFTIPFGGYWTVRINNNSHEETTYGWALWSHTPEPSTMVLLGSGVAALLAFGRKRLFKKA